MRYSIFIGVIIGCLIMACNSCTQTAGVLHGTWKSLWQKDMTLELTLHPDNHFKVMLTRPDMVHTNLGWYNISDNVFQLRDSVDYPLPVCNLSDTGKYHFSITRDTLQFKVIEDACERRTYALQLERFVKVK